MKMKTNEFVNKWLGHREFTAENVIEMTADLHRVKANEKRLEEQLQDMQRQINLLIMEVDTCKSRLEDF